MNTTFQTLLIILIIKHGFNAIKSCELNEEKCTCTFLTGKIIMDCWKKAQNQLNIIDLDVDLKLSNIKKEFQVQVFTCNSKSVEAVECLFNVAACPKQKLAESRRNRTIFIFVSAVSFLRKVTLFVMLKVTHCFSLATYFV